MYSYAHHKTNEIATLKTLEPFFTAKQRCDVYYTEERYDAVDSIMYFSGGTFLVELKHRKKTSDYLLKGGAMLEKDKVQRIYNERYSGGCKTLFVCSTMDNKALVYDITDLVLNTELLPTTNIPCYERSYGKSKKVLKACYLIPQKYLVRTFHIPYTYSYKG